MTKGLVEKMVRGLLARPGEIRFWLISKGDQQDTIKKTALGVRWPRIHQKQQEQEQECMGWGRGNSGTSSLRSLSAGIGTAVLQSCDRVVLWTHILSYETPDPHILER